MSKSAMGASVRFCGHRGVFIADIFTVGNVNVIRGNGPITPDTIDRDPGEYKFATHHMSDFPVAGFWQPRLGIFVVPESQVTKLPRPLASTRNSASPDSTKEPEGPK
jgi:hypothetical protein